MTWLDLKLSFSMADNLAGIWVLLVIAIAFSPLLFFLPEVTCAYFLPSAVFGLAYGTYTVIMVHYYAKYPSPKIPHTILLGLLGLNFGLALGWLALIVGIALHIGYFWLWVSVGLAGCAFVYGIFLACKRWKRVFLAAASLYLASGLLVTGLAAYQKHVVDSYAKLWKSKGWPMEAREIFPKPSTRTECQAWLDVIKTVKEYPLHDCIDLLQNEIPEIRESLRTGKNLDKVVHQIASRGDIPWEFLDENILKFTATMDACPYLQRFDAQEIEERQWDDFYTNPLDFFKWARFIYWRSVMFLQQGRYQECLDGLGIIQETAARMVPGDGIIISQMASTGIERQAIQGYTAALALNQQPFSEALMHQLRKRTEGDFTWVLRTLHVERLSQWHFYSRPYLHPAIIWKITMDYPQAWWLLKLPHYTPMMRIYSLKETLEQMRDYTSWTEWVLTLPDLEHGRFPLAEYRRKWPDNGWIGVDMGRNLSLIAQWRLLLMMDAVVEYHQIHGQLPERLEDIAMTVQYDPFDQKPLRYRKETGTRFVVYSIGPDLKDGSAKNLFVDGALNYKDSKDVGFRITLEK